MTRTRDILRWNYTARALLELAGLCVANAVLVALAEACEGLERWIDEASR